MRSAVLRPCGFVVTSIKGEFLPVADRFHAIGGEAERTQVCDGCRGTPIAKGKIVLGGPALVAMTFDGDGPGRMLLQHRGVLIERGLRRRVDIAAVEPEENR